MTELFPWEETEPESSTATARDMRPQPGGGEKPAEENEPGEPADIEPDLQPDGDPRELEDTEDDEATAGHASPEGVPDAAKPRTLPDTQTPRHGDPLRPHARERPVARKEYYSIGEVADLVGLPAHVLRYWESQFSVLNPSKNRSGNRAYQRKEIRLILLVKHLLYEEKYTVEGAKAKLDQLRRGGAVPQRGAAALGTEALKLLREDIAELRGLISASL
jgi:DNA-binding transcriptional MerR regulator